MREGDCRVFDQSEAMGEYGLVTVERSEAVSSYIVDTGSS